MFYLYPEQLAERLAEEVYSEISINGRLENDSVTVLIQNFAYESVSCDAVKGGSEDNLGGARFFQPNAIDRLPGVGEWADSPDPKFPSGRDPDNPLNRFANDFGFARAYRHPFIQNGKPMTAQFTPPLRAWFQRFVDRRVARPPSDLRGLGGVR